MKLSTLKKEAQRTTTYRGHRMSWGAPSGDTLSINETLVGVCRRCGMQVQLLTHPSPNEIDVTGEAVALNCNK